VDLTALGRVTLDTSSCIYYLDRPPGDPRRAVLLPLLTAVEQGAVTAVVSAVTVMELLVKPLRDRNREAEAVVRVFLDEFCEVVPATRPVAEVAARLRADHRLAGPDALICATGLVAQADAVLGNDLRWRQVEGLPYIHLDDLVGAGDRSGG